MSCSTTSSSSSWDSLDSEVWARAGEEIPEEVWMHVLEHVPLPQRLSQCALVCRAWASAGVALTNNIDAWVEDEELLSLLSWPQQHGQHVERLELQHSGYEKSEVQLPYAQLPNLHSLSMAFCHLKGDTASTQPAPGHNSSSIGTGSSAVAAANNMLLLPRLTDLNLHDYCNVPADGVMPLFAQWPSLTKLVLQEVEVHGANRQDVAAAGAVAVVSAVGSLSHLQSLELANLVPSLSAVEAKHFSAFAALSSLSALTVSQSGIISQVPEPLPRGAAGYMLPAGQRRPQMHTLCIDNDVFDWEFQRDDDTVAWCVSAAELQNIVAACPNLEVVTLTNTVQKGGAACLRQLDPCRMRSLSVAGVAFDDTAVPHVTCLTQLSRLSWCRCQITDLGLLQLTALKSLRSLYMNSLPALSTEVYPPHPLGPYYDTNIWFGLNGPNKAESALVWEQLLAGCQRSPVVKALNSLQQQHHQGAGAGEETPREGAGAADGSGGVAPSGDGA